jgi:hypothetical protein
MLGAINEVYGRYDCMSMDDSLAGPENLEGLPSKIGRSPSWVPEELRQDGRLGTANSWPGSGGLKNMVHIFEL